MTSFDFSQLVAAVADKNNIVGNSNSNSDIKAYLNTGSMVLDWELAERKHRGGYPSGRMIEIFGPEAVGKCLVSSSWISTYDGLKTLREVFTSAGLDTVCATKEITAESLNGSPAILVNRFGKPEAVKTFTMNGRRNVFTVKTRTGYKITATDNHPFLVMSSSGNWVWRRLAELSKGDFLVSQRGGAFGRNSIGMDISYVLGVLVADAHLSDGRIAVTNDDEFVIGRLSALTTAMGKTPRVYANRSSTDLHWSDIAAISRFYDSYGLRAGLAADKEVPPIVRSLCRDEVREFIRGYLDCECSVTKRSLEVTSASLKLLEVVKLLLLQFGVVATLTEDDSNYTKKTGEVETYHQLVITGRSFDRYLEEIGFGSPTRIAHVNEHKLVVFSGLDTIPYVSDLIRDMYDASETTRAHNRLAYDYMNDGHRPSTARLRHILESANWNESSPRNRLQEIVDADYFYDEVGSIDEAGLEPTFDFEMSESHSFISDGVIVHNSTLVSHALVSAQRGDGVLIDWVEQDIDGRKMFLPKVSDRKMKPGIAILIDSECKFPLDRAQRMGLDVSKLIRIVGEEDTTLTFEACIEKLEATLDKIHKIPYFQTAEVPVCVALDSLAQAPIEAELEGEGLQDGIAAKARKIRMAMRRLTSKISSMNIFMLFTNHIYARIGAPGSEVSGGRGLKLAASLRLGLNRPFKDHELKFSTDQVGIYTEIKCVKSSYCVPPDNIRIPIRYLNGINQHDELFTFFDEGEPCVPMLSEEGHRRGVEFPAGSKKVFYPRDFADTLASTAGLQSALVDVFERTMKGERAVVARKKKGS